MTVLFMSVRSTNKRLLDTNLPCRLEHSDCKARTSVRIEAEDKISSKFCSSDWCVAYFGRIWTPWCLSWLWCKVLNSSSSIKFTQSEKWKPRYAPSGFAIELVPLLHLLKIWPLYIYIYVKEAKRERGRKQDREYGKLPLRLETEICATRRLNLYIRRRFFVHM